MRIIDANTGHEVRIGVPFSNIYGRVTIQAINEGWLTAQALMSIDGEKPAWTPLTVRYLHPRFMFQKVGFINS